MTKYKTGIYPFQLTSALLDSQIHPKDDPTWIPSSDHFMLGLYTKNIKKPIEHWIVSIRMSFIKKNETQTNKTSRRRGDLSKNVCSSQELIAAL